jgi:hypothetical protein
MSRSEELSRIDRVEIDIDSRIPNLILGVSELSSISAKTAKRFIVSAYYKGIDDATLDDTPADFYLNNGYVKHQRLSVYPPWFHTPDSWPTDEEIVDYFEHAWELKLEEINLNLSAMATFLRSAYGSGHIYADLKHRRLIQ